MSTKNISIIFLLISLFYSAANAYAGPTEKAINKALKGKHRSEAYRARDQYRHPKETLLFFGLKRDMTVVEISPGSGGWYTEILAPVLRKKGKLYAAGYSLTSKNSSKYHIKSQNKYLAKLKAHPKVYNKVIVTELSIPDQTDIAPAGSADMVVTFRNTHNWINSGKEKEMFALMFKTLKPGGTLGLVQHRGQSGTSNKQTKNSGYVAEATVIKLAEEAGFKLAAKSEINANPKDTADHPEGVWTLPPSLALKDKDKEKYSAIGESDRMTLKFIKPKK